MEFIINAKDSAIPCSITIDDDNGKYMIRNADTSGEVFPHKEDLIDWIRKNWTASLFEDQDAYYEMIKKIDLSRRTLISSEKSGN